MIKIIKNMIHTETKKTVWRYYLYTFLVSLHFFSAVLVPFFTEWGHISKTQMQLLQSWFMLWFFLLEIPTGVIADRFGRKHSLALGALVGALASIIYASTPRFEVFLLGEFLFAASAALVSGADHALLYDSLKEDGNEHLSKKIFGRANAIMLLGYLISAPIGSMIAFKLGINFPMMLRSIPSVLAFFVACSIHEPAIHGKVSEEKRYLDIAKKGFVFFYKHPVLRLIALDAIVVAAAAYFVIWLYQPYLEQLNVPIVYFGLFHVLLLGGEILVSSQFVRMEKIFKSAGNFIRFSAAITALTFFLMAVYPHMITVTLFVVIGGGFGLSRMEYMTVFMNKLIPSIQRATVLSSISMFRRLALVLLNPIVGFTADHSLRFAALFVGLLPLLVFFFSPLEKVTLEETKTL